MTANAIDGLTSVLRLFDEWWLQLSSGRVDGAPGWAVEWAESNGIQEPATIRRLIAREFELHWTIDPVDERKPVEVFLARYAAWCDRELTLSMAGTEIFLGTNPDPEKYDIRFPSLRQELSQLFNVRRCLQTGNHRERSQNLQTIRGTALQPAVNPDSQQSSALKPSDRLEFRQYFGSFRRVNHGAFKDVYMARQEGLQREIAFKRLRAASEMDRHRFARESRMQALLDHQNIPPVMLLAEEHDGPPVIIEKWVQSPAWSESIGRGSAARRTDLQILLKVSRVVAFAHKRGIIHRDIKPENVLIGEFDQIYLTDWGTAAVFSGHDDSDSSLARISEDKGTVLGTPAYLPPEIVRGDSHLSSPASDVFQLGAVLYQICTGSPPFVGTQVAALTQASLGLYPPVPKRVPYEMTAVIQRAMAHNPADRYPDAGAFAEEISRLLDDENVTACRPRLRDYLRRKGRQHRTAVSTVGAAIGMGSFAAIIAAFVLASKNAELSAAITARKQYEVQLQSTNQQLQTSLEQLQKSERELRDSNQQLDQTNTRLADEQERLKLALQSGFRLLKGIETGQYHTLDDAYSDLLQRGGVLSETDQAGLLSLFEGISWFLKAQDVADQPGGASLLQKLLGKADQILDTASILNRASDALNQSIEENPRQGLAWLLRAQLRGEVRLEAPDTVLPDWNKAVELLPESSAASSGRGFCHAAMNNADAAIADLLRAKELDEKNEYAWLGLCLQYYNADRTDEAIEHAIQALRLQQRFSVNTSWKSRCSEVAMLSYWKRANSVAGKNDLQACQDYISALQFSTPQYSPPLWANLLVLCRRMSSEQRQTVLNQPLLCDAERPTFRFSEQILRMLFELKNEEIQPRAKELLLQLQQQPRLAGEINGTFLKVYMDVAQQSGAEAGSSLLLLLEQLQKVSKAEM